MIWLDICDEQGNAIYFDIHHVERRRVARRWRHSVSGTCGNGLDEVEVLVEPGNEGEVTFVDLSAGAGQRYRLMSGVDTGSLKAELLEAASRHCGLAQQLACKVNLQPHSGWNNAAQVNEKEPCWHSVG